MHTFGHPVDMAALKTVCKQWHIAIVEDAAEALGSFIENDTGRQHCGTFGDMGVLSFNGNKVITTGGGGAVLTNNEKYAERLRHLSTTAKTPHAWEYLHDEIGFNYRMPGINAALGCAQMKQLNKFLSDKLSIAEQYQSWAEDQSVSFVDAQEHAKPNFWLNALLLDDIAQRDNFLQETNENGVMTRPIWQPMHLLPAFQSAQCSILDNTIQLADRLVNVPSSARVV